MAVFVSYFLPNNFKSVVEKTLYIFISPPWTLYMSILEINRRLLRQADSDGQLNRLVACFRLRLFSGRLHDPTPLPYYLFPTRSELEGLQEKA